MKVTRSQLKQIIQEELEQYVQEQIGGELANYNVDDIKGAGDVDAGTISLTVTDPLKGGRKEGALYNKEEDAWVNFEGKPFGRKHQAQLSTAYMSIKKQLEAGMKASGKEVKDSTWGLEYKKGL